MIIWDCQIVDVLVQTMTPKGHFEIIWPLEEYANFGFDFRQSFDSIVYFCMELH